jgi:hypothetical protein
MKNSVKNKKLPKLKDFAKFATDLRNRILQPQLDIVNAEINLRRPWTLSARQKQTELHVFKKKLEHSIQALEVYKNLIICAGRRE